MVIDVAIQHFRRNVLECCDDGDTFGNQFRRLLCRRTLPHSESPTGASADARRQRNGGIDQNAAGKDRRLQLFQQRRLAFVSPRTGRAR